ncbi:MAG: ATP-binding cassette domain-containing protein [Proteobacteria bacterium]|nr:ATP-binding cassette domain-containing protein [Pseudomonadota bacterium]
MSLIQATTLTKTFGGENTRPVTAVQNLSFAVGQGEVVGLMGPNGAGKSTTMRLLAGFLQPTSGSAAINGHNLATHTVQAQRSLGYLAEVPPQEDHLTPFHLLTFHAQTHQLPDVPKAVADVAKLTRCAPYLHRKMGELSKGMKQRVHLACALIHNPPVLLLDEPTDGLDPNQKHELRLMLKQLAKPKGQPAKAILVSTHLLEEAEHLCTRLLIIHRGQILLDTTPAELAKQGKGDIHLAFRVLTTNRGGE